MGDNGFYDCVSLSEIYYEGTIDEFRKIGNKDGWDYNSGEYIVKCSDGNLSKDELH